jgi:predicted ATPase
MIPTALIFSRYKSFKERVVLNLAPLNVIIGRNGSGKSVISRLPLILAGGLKEEAEAPIDLFSGGVLHGSRYEDLIFERSAQPFELGAQIGRGKGSRKFITTLRFVIEKHTLAIEKFELYEDEDRLVCQLEIASPEEFTRSEPRYRRIQRRGETTISAIDTVHFEGLFPNWVSGDEVLSIELAHARSNFRMAFASPAYLGPFRSQANESPFLPAQGIRVLGPKGERARDMVADDKLRGTGELTRLVEKWFEESMGGNRVILKQNDRNPMLVVFDSERNIEVDLSETGAGFSQVLPVVVQTFARTLGRIKTPLLITEQPELHLHPAAHGAVGDLFVDAINNSTDSLPVIALCETHSEQIVTRLRRRVAEGALPAEQIKIISVAHQDSQDGPIEPLREISLDRFGTPDAWPVGVFDEAFNDLVELRQAVREKQTD